MSLIVQRTLEKIVSLSGVGLHTGKVVIMTLLPAPDDTGVVFRRLDLNPVIEVPANSDFVIDTQLNTTLGKTNISISTVEHILSVLSGLGIDNAFVDLTEREPPAMDGSVAPLIKLIQSVGLQAQRAPKKFIRIKRKVEVSVGDKYASLSPHEGFKLSMRIDFPHSAIANTPQTLEVDLSQISYIDEISSARTFGFLSEYEYLKQRNLALGASLENTLVIGDMEILNPEGLRYPDEFVRHKMLDAIGDLYLLGHAVIGEFMSYKSGHALMHELRKTLLNDADAWEILTLDSKQLQLPVDFSKSVVA